MTECAVVGCNNVGTHVFPRDRDRRKQWEIAIQRGTFLPCKSSKICGDHFTTEDYLGQNSETGDMFLRKTAIPSIFPSIQQQPNDVQEMNTMDNNVKEELASENDMDPDLVPVVNDSEEGMKNMFASVWVKVEVGEAADDDNQDCDHNIDCEPDSELPIPKPSKRKRTPKTILKCDYCIYTTPYKNCLDMHILGHSAAKPFKCILCPFATKQSTSLHRHMIGQHQVRADTGDAFKCNQCDYTTTYKWNLNAHSRKHSKEKNFKCLHCNYVTAYRHNFTKHSKVHNENTVFKCDKCPFETKFQGHITRHLSKIHNEVTETAFRCDHCNFATIAKWRLTIHLGRSKQEELLKCPYCDHQTEYMCESKKHKTVHFADMYKKKVTKDTEETADSKVEKEPDDFEWNDDNHEDLSNEKPKKRKHGHYQTYDLDPNCVDWKSIQVFESEDKNKPFQCILCSYTSRFKASVQRHFQRLHTGNQNRPYKCVKCNFSTKTKDQIALHNKRSESDKRLSCKECDFKTMFKCQYVLHQKSHYTHKCGQCEYTSKNKYDLQRHFIVAHSGEVFKCRYCDYKAARKDSLINHETTHTGIKPFNCEHCNYASVRKSFIVNHKKKHHGEVEELMTVVSESKIQSLRTVEEKRQESNLSGFQGLLSE